MTLEILKINQKIGKPVWIIDPNSKKIKDAMIIEYINKLGFIKVNILDGTKTIELHNYNNIFFTKESAEKYLNETII